MGKDMKLEVIYYRLNSDVKLEFGLHGDYPLRLLTDTCNDPKSFLHSLKRAVQRSAVIITVGGFNYDCYLPSVLALSVGRGTVELDLQKNGIVNIDCPAIIPDNSYPIVMNGTFCGCVLESGPQSIIMLTDNKRTRLDVIQKLIVPYLTEHYNYYER